MHALGSHQPVHGVLGQPAALAGQRPVEPGWRSSWDRNPPRPRSPRPPARRCAGATSAPSFGELRRLSDIVHPATGRLRAERVINTLHTCPIPEVARLGRTLPAWRAEIPAYFHIPAPSPTAVPKPSTGSSRRPGASPTASAISTTTDYDYSSAQAGAGPAPDDPDRSPRDHPQRRKAGNPVLGSTARLRCGARVAHVAGKSVLTTRSTKRHYPSRSLRRSRYRPRAIGSTGNSGSD